MSNLAEQSNISPHFPRTFESWRICFFAFTPRCCPSSVVTTWYGHDRAPCLLYRHHLPSTGGRHPRGGRPPCPSRKYDGVCILRQIDGIGAKRRKKGATSLLSFFLLRCYLRSSTHAPSRLKNRTYQKNAMHIHIYVLLRKQQTDYCWCCVPSVFVMVIAAHTCAAIQRETAVVLTRDCCCILLKPGNTRRSRPAVNGKRDFFVFELRVKESFGVFDAPSRRNIFEFRLCCNKDSGNKS